MKLKFYLLFLALIFGFSGLVHGQTGIGTNNPDQSAQLDVESTDKGVLIPRLTEVQKNAIPVPANGLLIYQTDGEEGFWYYSGVQMQWILLGAEATPFAQEGFSATTTAAGVSSDTQIGGWTVSSPYFNTTTFDPVTGTFTAPNTGRYQISATINYSTTGPLTGSLAGGINPTIVVRRTSPVTTDLIAGNFPILDVNIALMISLRAILGTGTVTLSGVVELVAGDTVGLFYVANDLTLGLNLGGPGTPNIWSVHQISD